MGQLGAAAIAGWVNKTKVVFQIDSSTNGNYRLQNSRENLVFLVVLSGVVGGKKGSSIEKQPFCSRIAAPRSKSHWWHVRIQDEPERDLRHAPPHAAALLPSIGIIRRIQIGGIALGRFFGVFRQAHFLRIQILRGATMEDDLDRSK